MEKLDKDLIPQNDIPSETVVADETLEDVAGGGFEEFRRYSRKKDKEAMVVPKIGAVRIDH